MTAGIPTPNSLTQNGEILTKKWQKWPKIVKNGQKGPKIHKNSLKLCTMY